MLLNHKARRRGHAFGVLPLTAERGPGRPAGAEHGTAAPARRQQHKWARRSLAGHRSADRQRPAQLSQRRRDPGHAGDLLLPVADLLDRAAALSLCHGELTPAACSLSPTGQGIGWCSASLARQGAGDGSFRTPDRTRHPVLSQPRTVRRRTAGRCGLRPLCPGGHPAEAVAGRPPFVADNPHAASASSQCSRAAAAHLAPQVQNAEALDAFFVRALAKEPAARFASATAMLEEFTLALKRRPRSARRSDDAHRAGIACYAAARRPTRGRQPRRARAQSTSWSARAPCWASRASAMSSARPALAAARPDHRHHQPRACGADLARQSLACSIRAATAPSLPTAASGPG